MTEPVQLWFKRRLRHTAIKGRVPGDPQEYPGLLAPCGAQPYGFQGGLVCKELVRGEEKQCLPSTGVPGTGKYLP